MSFGRVWWLRFMFLVAGLFLTRQGLLHANIGAAEPWGWEIALGLITTQMVFYVPNPVSAPGSKSTIYTIPLDVPVCDEYRRTGKLPKMKKYRPAHNRKLPYYTGKSSFGKHVTHRSWKTKKRQEAKELEKAAHKFLMGCAFTPVRDFGVMLEKIRDMRKKLSVNEWGR